MPVKLFIPSQKNSILPTEIADYLAIVKHFLLEAWRCWKKIVEVDVLPALTMVAVLVMFHFSVFIGYMQSVGPSTKLVVSTALII